MEEEIKKDNNPIVNDIPIETLFKHLVKEKNKIITEYNVLAVESKKLYKEYKALKKKVQAQRIDGSFVSQQNYDAMANEKNKAIEDRDLWINRYIQLKKENDILKDEFYKGKSKIKKIFKILE